MNFTLPVLLMTLFIAACGSTTLQVKPNDPLKDKRGSRTPSMVLQDSINTTNNLAASDPTFTAHIADAKGILIFPKTLKIGVGFAGQQGPGVLLLKQANGGWTLPVFQWYRSATYGLQAGIQETDLVAVIKDDATLEAVRAAKFTINMDLMGTAGQQSTGGQWTSMALGGGLWVATRSQGAFAGISGGLGQIQDDTYWTGETYGDHKLSAEDIFRGETHGSIDAALSAAKSGH